MDNDYVEGLRMGIVVLCFGGWVMGSILWDVGVKLILVGVIVGVEYVVIGVILKELGCMCGIDCFVEKIGLEGW